MSNLAYYITLHLTDDFIQGDLQLLKGIGYNHWTNVGLGALLKGTSAMDEGVGIYLLPIDQGGIQTCNPLIQRPIP